MRGVSGHKAALAAAIAVAAGATGCRDLDRFSSKGDGFEGPVVRGDFVRAGIAEDARMCLTLDTDHLQDAPGTITTTDGRFRATALRPIPQLWHDPLSMLSFGDGREKNLVYMATPNGEASDVTVIVSLMHDGNIEVRLVRGAPYSDGGAPPSGQAPPMFGVFTLGRRQGPC
jgi:hypothetical protein